MGVVILTSQDGVRKTNGAKGCVEFLPGLQLTFTRACTHMAWPSSGQRQRVDPCPQSLRGLEIPGRPRLCIPAPSEAAGFAPDPQADGRPDPGAQLGGQLCDQQALERLLRIQLAQLVPAGLGPAGHLAPTPLPAPVFPSLWVLCSFFMASIRGRRQRAVSCRERAGAGVGRREAGLCGD